MELRPFTGTYLTDPAATWRTLLDSPERVHYADDLGMWLISRYDDVRSVLGDSENFSNALTLAPVYQVCPEAMSVLVRIDAPPTTAAADAPTHPRTRRALRAVFANTTRRAKDEYGPLVARRVDQLLSRLAGRSGQVVDLVPEFTAELPLLVIVDILGAPEDDIPHVKRWADGQIALVWGCPSPEEQVHLAQGLLEFWRYCQELVAARLRGGTLDDDVVSRALRYRGNNDDVLTVDEVASFAFNLLVAGHETTAGLLAHSLYQALSVPGRWEHMVRDPSIVPSFVEETLRFAPPIDGWLRVTRAPVTIGEVTIPAGARCLLLIGAANRDSTVFSDPDMFDSNRLDGKDHLSFGYGQHFCIGAALARLEAQVALARLAETVVELRLAPGHVSSYHPNIGFRAHRDLPVVIEFAGISAPR
jgi:cytochrome P450